MPPDCRACLGIKITSNQANDFIAQMRLALQARGAQENEAAFPLTTDRKTTDTARMGTLGVILLCSFWQVFRTSAKLPTHSSLITPIVNDCHHQTIKG